MRTQSTKLAVTMGLIIGGGSQNLYQIYNFGCALDFIKFFNISMFNVSDVFIMVGVALSSIVLYYEH